MKKPGLSVSQTSKPKIPLGRVASPAELAALLAAHLRALETQRRASEEE